MLQTSQPTEPGQRKMHEAYLRGLFWILRERAGNNGGWPPRDVSKVSGWTVVRMLAAMSDRTPRSVAIDIVESAQHMERD